MSDPNEANQWASNGDDDWPTEDIVFLSLIGFGVVVLVGVSLFLMPYNCAILSYDAAFLVVLA